MAGGEKEPVQGQTKLTGTTVYHHDVWPSIYWKLWSDYILHKIHTRVLTHIKEKAERNLETALGKKT